MAEVYKANPTSHKATKGRGKSKKKRERKSVTHLRKEVGKMGRDSLFTSFSSFPSQVCFETQEKGEAVVLFMRQHPVVNLPWIIMTVFLLTIPPLFEYFSPYMMLPTNYQWMMSLIFYLFVVGVMLAKSMAWFFNIYIVTDERVVDVDFVNLFYRVISTAKIEEIQDLSIIQSGVWETFFGYGKVEIQTAAEVTQFEFDRVPHPDKVGSLLNQMIDMEEQEKLEGRVK